MDALGRHMITIFWPRLSTICGSTGLKTRQAFFHAMGNAQWPAESLARAATQAGDAAQRARRHTHRDRRVDFHRRW